MNFEQMVILSGGGKNRDCMVNGGVAMVAVAVMCFFPGAGIMGLAVAIGNAAKDGCFD